MSRALASRRARRAERVRAASSTRDTAQKTNSRNLHSPRPRLGDLVVEARGVRKAYGEPAVIDDLNFTLPRGGIVGVSRPNAPARQRSSDDHRSGEADEGRCASARRADSDTSSSRDALAPNKSVWEEISAGRGRIDDRQAAGAVACLRLVVQLQGSQQQRKVGCSTLMPFCRLPMWIAGVEPQLPTFDWTMLVRRAERARSVCCARCA